jgi:hypothetical protein
VEKQIMVWDLGSIMERIVADHKVGCHNRPLNLFLELSGGRTPFGDSLNTEGRHDREGRGLSRAKKNRKLIPALAAEGDVTQSDGLSIPSWKTGN